MTAMNSFRPGWVAAFLVSLAGCAPPEAILPLPQPEQLLSERPPPVGRTCRASSTPARLPAVDVMVDSAALYRDLASLWRERRLGAGYAVLSLTFDRNGWNARREVIEHDLPAQVADSLQELVFAHRREVAPGASWGARLRMDLDGAPRFRTGRQEICAPRLLDADPLSPLAGLWNPRERFAASTLPSTVWVRVLVDESGAIAEMELERGMAGVHSEMALLHLVRSLGFEPATVDGMPVASWARIPIPAGMQ